MDPELHDLAVKNTSSDAADAKAYAAKLGYINDRYAKYFAKSSESKLPIISRGYFARVAAFDRLVESFIRAVSRTGGTPQIVCLGAGLDTRAFKLLEQGADIQYYEVDFPDVCHHKLRVMARNAEIRGLLGFHDSETFKKCVQDESSISSKGYHLLSGNLRELSTLEGKMREQEIDFSRPTMIIIECVLSYMAPEHSSALVSWIGRTFGCAMLCTYEIIKPTDAFGRTMQINLHARGCDLLSLEQFPSIDSHKARALESGFDRFEALDMNAIYYNFIDRKEIERIEKLQLLDELEEWKLLQSHYFVGLSIKDSQGILDNINLECSSDEELSSGPHTAVDSETDSQG